MNYLNFSLIFMAIHTASYILAGVVALNISQDLYEGDTRLMDFLVDPQLEGPGSFMLVKVLPAQVLRGLLMSVVLYPIAGFLGDLSFFFKFLFFAGLLYIYTDLSSAAPFPSNLEGIVYMKGEYVSSGVFWKLQVEMVIYSLLFGLFASWLLFL